MYGRGEWDGLASLDEYPCICKFLKPVCDAPSRNECSSITQTLLLNSNTVVMEDDVPVCLKKEFRKIQKDSVQSRFFQKKKKIKT